MAGQQYTSQSTTVGRFGYLTDTEGFNGGVNSTAGPLYVKPNESSDLLNVDFDKFGSILKRSGYTVLSTASVVGAHQSDGLQWFEFVNSSGVIVRYAMNVVNGAIYYMSALNGTWIAKTGSLTITAGNHHDFENYNNLVFGTDGLNPPWQWDGGSGNATTVPAFIANGYTFTVYGITVPPAVGDTYTDNGITYTITYLYLSNAGGATSYAGSIIATGSGVPIQTDTLVRATGSGDANISYENSTVNANITSAKFVKQYNNYLFWANVTVGTVSYKTRIYWSNIEDPNSVSADSWIEVGYRDGQQITGIKVLGQSLVIYKERSIYQLYFTGDSDVPFILPGGGKMVASSGCIAPFSIQDIDGGHVFLGHDGLYTNDGTNIQKISYRIQTTLDNLNTTYLPNSVSNIYKIKNKYMMACCSGGASTADTIIVWDWYNNAFSVYSGIDASAMMTVYVNGYEETPYFADYNGYTYKMEVLGDDYPLGTQTAINAYYWTNWRSYYDLCDQKGIPQIYVYYQLSSAALTLAYSYDFEGTEQFQTNVNLQISAPLWGVMLWGQGTWSGTGGGVKRIDLTGRGRVVRFMFGNSNLNETFRIDGIGTLAHLETNI
jgi:hypothetical protein